MHAEDGAQRPVNWLASPSPGLVQNCTLMHGRRIARSRGIIMNVKSHYSVIPTMIACLTFIAAPDAPWPSQPGLSGATEPCEFAAAVAFAESPVPTISSPSQATG